MNRIEDEPIKFYLEHEAQIREWAALEAEVRKFVDHFYRSLQGDLDAALRNGRIADDDVESFFHEMPNYRGLALRRHGWPKGSDDPDVRLEWHRERVRFSEHDLICGVRTNVERYRHPFTKKTCPNHPGQNSWWPAYRNVDPPVGKFWEGDNLTGYGDRLVETLVVAWKELAPLVDEALHHPVDA